MRHGERSAKSRAAWRELNAAVRALAVHHREQRKLLDGALPASPNSPGETWLQRIAQEIVMLDF
jgi:hypothetical protein